jgi:peptidoglycan/xylan/chitin deacetylase (PgdA/CDA1 family)
VLTALAVSALLLPLIGVPVTASADGSESRGEPTTVPSASAVTQPSAAATATAETTPTPEPEPEPIPVKSVKFDARKLLFGKKGDHLQLKATIKPKGADTSDLVFLSSNKKVATVSKTGKVTATGYGTCTITVTVGGKTALCPVQVAKKWVAITFDDGPGKPTTKLLKGLKKRKVTVTFFVVGTMAKSRPKVLKQESAAGHEIANHTWNHNGSAKVLRKALKKTDKVIKKATGSNSKLMRPPGGAINKTTRKCGKPIILWSVDPKDWRDRNANTVYTRVIKGTKSGSIVLLHDIHPTSVTAGLKIVDKLKKKGYAFVTVSQLLGSPKKNKVYTKGSAKVRTQKIT